MNQWTVERKSDLVLIFKKLKSEITGPPHLGSHSSRLQLERETMTGFISPESHFNIKKQLMDLQRKQRKFGEVFGHMEGVETKVDSMVEAAEALGRLEIQSSKFLEEGDSEKCI